MIAILVLVFLIQSFISRSLHSDSWWKYFLYLTNWGRVLAVLTYIWEAVLVTTRWRRELDGENILLEGVYPCYYRPGGAVPHVKLCSYRITFAMEPSCTVDACQCEQ